MVPNGIELDCQHLPSLSPAGFGILLAIDILQLVFDLRQRLRLAFRLELASDQLLHKVNKSGECYTF
jgi:hypothetical protein